MAASFTLLDSGSTSAGGTTLTTASVSPAASSKVVVIVAGILGSAPTCSGLGLSWSLDAQVDPFGGSTRDLCVFIGTGTATSGAVTVTRGGSDTFTAHAYVVVEGASTTGKVQSASGYTEDVDPVLTVNYGGAWAGGSAGLAAFVNGGGNYTSTPRSGWTELVEVSLPAAAGQLVVHTRTTSDSAGGADYTASGGGGVYRGGYVLEFGASGGGSTQPPRTMQQFRQRRAA